MKIGIDIGNYQVKTSKGIIFDSKIAEVDEFKSTNDIILIDNMKYYVGEGMFETESRKFDKSNYIPLLLSAISKSTKEENIDLVLGLPIIQYKNKEIKKDLMKLLKDKTFTFGFNEKVNICNIKSLKIMPEGITGFIYLLSSDKVLKNQIGSRDVVLIDVGGGTTDIALIQNNSAKIPTSIPKGTLNVYDIIYKALLEKYYDVKITKEKIPYYIEHGFYYEGEKQNIQFAINKTVDIFKEIYFELKMNYPIKTEAVVIMGGGANLIGQTLKKYIPDLIIRDNIKEDIFANALGYEFLS